MREVLYYRLIRNHSPSAKANFVRLYINDQDWGIYLNVQQLNKDFLEEWYESNDGINLRADRPDGSSTGPGGPGSQWGDGTTALNYLGTDTAKYQTYYTLKSSDTFNPWPELIKVCNILNNSGTNLEIEAPKVMDIDKILWHLALEIVFTDDDSYVFKGKMDYYLYMDAETKRWTSYDYDANSTFSTPKISTWPPFYNESKVNYPLLNKLLSVPAFRQRYLAHMRTIIHELLDESKVNAIIDGYDSLIRSAVLADTKKITTLNAFNNALTELKNFIRNRKTYLLTNSEVKNIGPQIIDTKYLSNGTAWSKVTKNDQVKFTTQATHASGISAVNLHYATGFSGTFNVISMVDNGMQGDEKANDGIYTANMPTFDAGTFVKAFIEAMANDAVKTRAYFPLGAEHQLITYNIVTNSSSTKTVVVNEFMASNSNTVKDEAGDFEDWIELYNLSDNDINMVGYYITDNPANLTKWKFPDNTIIKANGYLTLWADEEQEEGPLHSNFKLSAGGEIIYLLDNNKVFLDSLTFGSQVENKSSARIPNGTGPFVIGAHTFGKNNSGVSSISKLENSQLKIYPNPANRGTIYVENMADDAVHIQIYNVLGVKLLESKVEPRQNLDMELYEKGLYLVKDGKFIYKLMVID